MENPIPPCPITDAHYEALSLIHNTSRGHNKKTLWKHVNRGRAEDDQIKLWESWECQQFLKYCYVCRKMSNREVESVFSYNPNIDLSKRRFTVMGDVLDEHAVRNWLHMKHSWDTV